MATNITQMTIYSKREETFYSLNLTSLILIDKKHAGIYYYIHEAHGTAGSVELFLAMMILTIDRLFCVLDPVKHKVKFTNGNVKRIIYASWILSLTVAVLNGIIGEMFSLENMLLIRCTIIVVVYPLVAIVTYSIISIRIKISEKRFNRTPAKGETVSKHFKISALIIITYLLLNTIPTIFNAVLSKKVTYINFIIHEGMLMCFYFGLVTDPLIYVFLTKHFRDIIRSKVFRNQSNFENNQERKTREDNIIANRYANKNEDGGRVFIVTTV